MVSDIRRFKDDLASGLAKRGIKLIDAGMGRSAHLYLYWRVTFINQDKAIETRDFELVPGADVWGPAVVRFILSQFPEVQETK